MPTPDELVQSAITYFFEKALPQPPINKTFDQLPSPSVHLGSYSRWDNSPVSSSVGPSITPRFALRVSPALPVTGGKPIPAGVTAPTTGPARHLLWMRTVADAALDDAAEIARVMADLDSFVTLFASPSNPAGAGSSDVPQTDTAAAARASEWGAAIVAARASLAVNLSTLTEVPQPLQAVAPDLPALKEVLRHFFTYAPDGSYYQRWAGAGRDASNPAHLTPAYKQQNAVEQQLQRDHVYLYAVLPESVLGAGDLGSGTFREIVVRFDPTTDAANPFVLAALHTVRLRAAAAPYCDFVFFYAADGLGVPLPPATLSKSSAGLVNLLGELTESPDLSRLLTSSQVVSTREEGVQQVHLVATVSGEPTLPPGVISSGEGDVRVLLAPADQVAAVAALPEVVDIGLLAPSRLHNDRAQAMVNLAALNTKLPAGNKQGQGVLIGVIDSGIDGSHPAFAGRIHAVWDMGSPPAVPPGPTPAAKHPAGDPLHAAYAAFNVGVELTGPAAATSQDINFVNGAPGVPFVPPSNGHGTHVSATAAGAEVKDGAGNVLVPAGVAPLARLAVVRGIQASPTGIDETLAARWIFQKATELGVPCVINMSFGHHDHGHDGFGLNSAALLSACRDGAGNYRPGRVVVASAGNDRQAKMHVRRQIPANSGDRNTVAVLDIPPAIGVILDIWIKDPTGTKPATFPVKVYFYRRTARRNTFHDVTRKVALGTNAVGANAAGTFNGHNTRIDVTSQVSHPVTGDHMFRVLFRTTSVVPPPAGSTLLAMLANQWGVVVVNESPHPLDVHMYLPAQNASFADAVNDDDHAFLIGQPAASAAAISVASCNSRLTYTDMNGKAGPPIGNEQSRLNELSTFSSPGPLRPTGIAAPTFSGVAHEVNGIDVAAPGAFTQSALSSQVATAAWLADPHHQEWVVNNRSQIMAGTSMAAPVVTGLVATILSAEPTLTMPQVLDRLKQASAIPPGSDFQPAPGGGPKPLSPDWGYGLVDAAKLRP